MPVNLDAPLRWKTATPDEQLLLNDLQANILKGHGRDHTQNVFLKFDTAQGAAVKAWIHSLAPQLTSASKQLHDAANFQLMQQSGETIVLFYLSALGYDALNVPAADRPTDPSFRAGMKAHGAALHDPAPATWDAPFRDDVHALLLVGDDSAAVVAGTVAKLTAALPTSVTVLGVETGNAFKNKNGDGMEHFGYVDGRSQPLLLVEDTQKERLTKDGIQTWDPAFPLQQVLTPDPGGAPESMGSYFVFRKLEQNVKGFKDREDLLAAALSLTGDDAERAGAMMVGRFEDGTPVVLQSADGMHNPVPNSFNYFDDPDGTKCPFHAHIRKSNPRGESVGAFAQTIDEERSHIMARRGITFGDRKVNAVGKGIEFADQPTGGVGLLFMAYQSNVGNQFEFTQVNWVNNGGFVKAGTGVDPVIGQGNPGGQASPVRWGGPAEENEFRKFDFRGFVTLKGGEYFFAPSIGALKNI
jgi:Dyp-type peroxidase family